MRDWEQFSHKCIKAQEGNKCFVLLFMHVSKPEVAIVLITVVEASISKLDQSEAELGDLNLDDVQVGNTDDWQKRAKWQPKRK